MSEFQPEHLEAHYRRMQSDGHSVHTIRAVHCLLRSVATAQRYTYAVDELQRRAASQIGAILWDRHAGCSSMRPTSRAHRSMPAVCRAGPVAPPKARSGVGGHRDELWRALAI